jgi:hypothetical protein
MLLHVRHSVLIPILSEPPFFRPAKIFFEFKIDKFGRA